MSQLTQIAFVVRKAIVIFIVLAIFIAVGSFVWRFIPETPVVEVPIPTPTPAVLFGKLPAIKFPESEPQPTMLKLETIAGGPPVSTSSAQVYFVPQKAPNLFSRKNAENFAEKLGFTEKPEEPDTNTLSYIDPETQDTLIVDSTTNNFRLRRNFIDTNVITKQSLPGEQQLHNLAEEYFQSLNVWNSTLTKATVNYVAFQGTNLVQVDKPRDAQLARVYFIRPSIGGYPIITTQVTSSQTYLLFAAEDRDITSVIEASYQNFPVSEYSSSSYPTISGQKAWEKLVRGEGYIAIASGDTVTVREGYLAYFQEEGYQSFLQPVYVFKGDGGFVGVVAAIDPLWIGN